MAAGKSNLYILSMSGCPKKHIDLLSCNIINVLSGMCGAEVHIKIILAFWWRRGGCLKEKPKQSF